MDVGKVAEAIEFVGGCPQNGWSAKNGVWAGRRLDGDALGFHS
jgi:hypothetical protein